MNGPLLVGRVVERYRVEETLGEGGTAVVYRVRHLHLGTDHALKVMTLQGAQAGPRLLLEGRVQAALRHPNIVAVTDVLELDGSYGLLMEYVPPPALSVWLRDRGPQRPEIAELLFRGIVEGVRHAHAHGLVHRDLKPANVLLARTDEGLLPKVADFGLARILDEDSHRHTRSGLAMGTPQYMAPEQFRDAKTVDRRADIFSLGCILHELLSGVPAFPWSDMIGVYEAMTRGRREPLPPGLPAKLIAVIEGCLAPDRDQRVSDCGSLLNLLDGGPRGPTLVPKAGVWIEGEELPSSRISSASLASPTLAAHDLAEPSDATLSAFPMAPARGPDAPTLALPARAEPAAAPKLAPMPAPVPAAPKAPDPAQTPSLYPTPPERKWLFPAIGLGVIALGAAAFTAWPPPVQPVAPVEPAVVAASEQPVLPPVVPPVAVPVEAPVQAPVVKVETTFQTRPKERPTETPRPPPVAPVVTTVEPVAAPSPKAEPAPKSEIVAEAPTSTDAKVRVTGADRAWLEGANGRHSLPGKVPPGAYEIWADFGSGAVGAGEARLSAGDDAEVSCNAGFTTCKVRR